MIALQHFVGRRGFPVFAPAGLRERTYHPSEPWIDWNAVTDGDRVDVGTMSLTFSRTDHGPETLAVRVDGGGRALGYSADTGPGWSLEALGPGLDLALCEATVPISEEGKMQHLSARQAGSSARAAGVRHLVLTHLWPTLEPESARSEGSEAFGAPVEVASTGARYQAGGPMSRADGRDPEDLRPLSFVRDYTEFALGSVLVSMGRTRVLCTASVDERVPPWMRGKGMGWVTAEYSMLPGSTPERSDREVNKGKPSGRTQEIQRLIGRSLRSVTDMAVLGERQVVLDCDVLQADGGTRTASISGAYVALHDACTRLLAAGRIRANPLTAACGAVSVGIVDGIALLDLDYSEDVRAQVDMNVVMTSGGRFVEVQGTAEGLAFSRSELDDLLGLGESGIAEILDAQEMVLMAPPPARVKP